MNSNLPTLGNDLTPSSSTRLVLGHLTEQHLAPGPGFAQARVTLETWADDLATGDGSNTKFPLTAPGREISMIDLFSPMDRAQAARLLDELFTDIVPHLSSKRQFLQDIGRGKTDSGAEVLLGDLMASYLAGALGQLSDEDMASIGMTMTTTMLQQLTWTDDGDSSITSRVRFDMSVENKSGPGQSVKF